MLLQIFRRNFYSNASCFSLLLLYLGNSQVSVYRTIGPTLVKFLNLFISLIYKGLAADFLLYHVSNREQICKKTNVDDIY